MDQFIEFAVFIAMFWFLRRACDDVGAGRSLSSGLSQSPMRDDDDRPIIRPFRGKIFGSSFGASSHFTHSPWN